MNSSVNSKVYEKVQDARNLVIDTLANYDDTLAEKVIKSGSYKSVLTTDIVASLQKVVLMQVNKIMYVCNLELIFMKLYKT